MVRFVESRKAQVGIDPRYCCKCCKASLGSANEIVKQEMDIMKRGYSPARSELIKCNRWKVTLLSLIGGESEHRIIRENLAEIKGGYRMLHVGRISVS